MNQERILDCTGLSMHFGGLAALSDLDLFVNRGEVLGLVGPNGSGKTTFFNVVSGIYRPTTGRVVFQGEDITGLSPQRIYHSGIVRTFQRSRLCLELTVFDNVMIGNHKRLDLGFWNNLVRRGRFLAQYEEGVERAGKLLAALNPALVARMFDPVGDLPMIDRRRIEICRALVGRPSLLFLDEPSAGMTHDETRQLMDEILNMGSYSEGLSIVLIEHEMNVIRRVTDRCVVLNFGRKLFEGSYDEVAADPVVQEAYLGKEVEEVE
ncbi:MAG: ABC transporter ATP-binding protein [Desulfovibrionaceae bacterium]|jgi:ABC-type branched-subunit amino acid transport system ATPase component|nr:ABC transporter ATP-binding protein [Desulfovibrionaceae bacterium]